jgi:predicted RNA-binding protein YlxR (DUF448 family)
MGAGPLRTCVGCRRRREQHEMVRVALRPTGEVAIGRDVPGRGAYVCRDRNCVEQAVRSGRLSHALRLKGPFPEETAGELLEESAGGQT